MSSLAEEVKEVFLEMLYRDDPIYVYPDTFDNIYCGNVYYKYKDYLFTIFNDCWELDYLDKFIFPEGRVLCYDDLQELIDLDHSFTVDQSNRLDDRLTEDAIVTEENLYQLLKD